MDLMERFDAYITPHYFVFFQQLSMLAMFPNHSPKVFFALLHPHIKKLQF